jgi:hypothetical protein
LGIEPDATVSLRVLEKMVYAGTHATSFQQAEADVKALAELQISAQRIARATRRIGQERVAQREARVEAWEKLRLPQQQQSPRVQVPMVACVEMDGGRVQIRDRKRTEPVDKGSRKGRFWRESKVGCLLSMTSVVSAEDPCPQIPQVFVDPRRIQQISREIKGFSAEGDLPETAPQALEDRAGRPEVLVRSVTATRQDLEPFGKQLAAAAWQRGFAAAPRKAFVGDGAEANWSIWQRHFSHYTPILDFIHAICYVFAAALAGRSVGEGWPVYCQWAQWVWSGQVDQVIAALAIRQEELGTAAENEAEDSPRTKVADALRYLKNQKSRMRYDEYRRQGLPITSSHIESTIKQINRRVKGSEKFWSGGGAESLLQLAADYLSETDPLATFWRERPTLATGQRHYQTAG